MTPMYVLVRGCIWVLGFYQCWIGIVFFPYHLGIYDKDFTHLILVGYGYLIVFVYGYFVLMLFESIYHARNFIPP